MFTKVKSGPSKRGSVQDTYSDGASSLVVVGTRGALVDRAKGVKKVVVSVSGNVATIVSDASGFLHNGYEAQDWLHGGV
jgi:hypothetical protein